MATNVGILKERDHHGWRIVAKILLVIFIGPLLCVISLIGGAATGIFGDAQVYHQTYSEPRDGIESALIEINMGVGNLTVESLNDTNVLFNADLTYIGGLDYAVSGDTVKQIRLHQTQGEYDFFGVLSFLNINIHPTDNQDDLPWLINLSANVPLELMIESGLGDFELDFQELLIADLQLKTGVGNGTITLAQPEQSYRVTLQHGVGDTTVVLPEGAAVRVEVEMGIGNVRASENLERISDTDESELGDKGVWETENFNAADEQIILIFDGGIGDLTLQ